MTVYYGTVQLTDGPNAGRLVPTVGAPVYGFCLQVNRPRSRFLRSRTDIYKIVNPMGMRAQATYVGTLR